MNLSKGKVRSALKQFELTDLYFQQRDYRKLEQVIKSSTMIENLYDAADYQKYYYYLGVCEFTLRKNITQALSYLKEALTYSSQKDRIQVSDVEIQLISCIGKIYGVAGKSGEARYYLSRSIQLFHESIQDRTKSEFTQIFYNYGSFFIASRRNRGCLRTGESGNQMGARKEQLLLLERSIYFEKFDFKNKGEINKALFYEELAQAVKKISKSL